METSDFSRYLDDVAAGFQRSQVLFTALRAGVFEHLTGPVTAEQLAARLGWAERGVRMLLDGLVALELAEKDGDKYQNAPPAAHCLVSSAPDDQRHILLHKSHGWDTWAKLEQAVRTGKSVRGDRRERPKEELRAFICGMGDIARSSAKAMLTAIDLSPYRKMLDLGGGPGAYTITFLRAHPDMRGVILDQPDVLDIAREQVDAAGLDRRIELMPGDLTQDTFGTGYDLILVSNIIHSYDFDTNQGIVRRCFDALEPGGLLIIKDFLVNPGRTGPPFGLMFALHMLVHTESGDTYSTEEAAAWTQAAGFAPGRLLSLTPHTRLWLAERPR